MQDLTKAGKTVLALLGFFCVLAAQVCPCQRGLVKLWVYRDNLIFTLLNLVSVSLSE